MKCTEVMWARTLDFLIQNSNFLWLFYSIYNEMAKDQLGTVEKIFLGALCVSLVGGRGSIALPWFFFVPLFRIWSGSRTKTWLTDNSEWRTALINHPSLIRTTEKLHLFTLWSIFQWYALTYYMTTLYTWGTPEEKLNFKGFYCVFGVFEQKAVSL